MTPFFRALPNKRSENGTHTFDGAATGAARELQFVDNQSQRATKPAPTSRLAFFI
jgi:hypothetical protein